MNAFHDTPPLPKWNRTTKLTFELALVAEGYATVAAARESLKRALERNDKSGVQTSGSMARGAILLVFGVR
jgi:hypothetical protein